MRQNQGAPFFGFPYAARVWNTMIKRKRDIQLQAYDIINKQAIPQSKTIQMLMSKLPKGPVGRILEFVVPNDAWEALVILKRSTQR
jgi:hypothetical protein